MMEEWERQKRLALMATTLSFAETRTVAPSAPLQYPQQNDKTHTNATSMGGLHPTFVNSPLTPRGPPFNFDSLFNSGADGGPLGGFSAYMHNGSTIP
jgi:hypothetical protein